MPINISKSTYDLITKDLNVASLRSKVIGQNIANFNTKNYKRSDVNVSFGEALNGAKGSVDMQTTDSRHLTSDGKSGVSIVQDNTTTVKQDGNNVDVDAEMTNLTSNNMLYESLISELNNRMNMTKYIINGR